MVFSRFLNNLLARPRMPESNTHIDPMNIVRPMAVPYMYMRPFKPCDSDAKRDVSSYSINDKIDTIRPVAIKKTGITIDSRNLRQTMIPIINPNGKPTAEGEYGPIGKFRSPSTPVHRKMNTIPIEIASRMEEENDKRVFTLRD